MCFMCPAQAVNNHSVMHCAHHSRLVECDRYGVSFTYGLTVKSLKNVPTLIIGAVFDTIQLTPHPLY